jgi:hypothetical protein
MICELLELLKRDKRHIYKLLYIFVPENKLFHLNHKEQRMLWIIDTVYIQQKHMYDKRIHSHSNRIVSIFQPHVRPIPRCEIKSKIEFGSKLVVWIKVLLGLTPSIGMHIMKNEI